MVYNKIDAAYTLYLLTHAFIDIDDKLDTKILSKEEFIKKMEDK